MLSEITNYVLAAALLAVVYVLAHFGVSLGLAPGGDYRTFGSLLIAAAQTWLTATAFVIVGHNLKRFSPRHLAAPPFLMAGIGFALFAVLMALPGGSLIEGEGGTYRFISALIETCGFLATGIFIIRTGRLNA